MKNPKPIIHPTAVVDEGAQLGDGTKVWHFTHISAGARIGRDCVLGQNVYVADNVELGRGCKVQNNVSIYTGVSCAEDVFLGPSMVFTNVLNPRSAVNRKQEFRATRVGRGASIGANATIVCGNEIGEYALVGAGSVVTRPVKAYALVHGVPAKQHGWVSAHGSTLQLDAAGKARCPDTGQLYRLVDGQLQPSSD